MIVLAIQRSAIFQITYAYIAPVIITCGIIGDVFTVITLTHPLLRKSTIVYTYLTLLAMTDLVGFCVRSSNTKGVSAPMT